MLSNRIRALIFVSLFAPTIACGDASFNAAESSEPDGQTAEAYSVAEARTQPVYPDYVAEGMTDCRDIKGEGGHWDALSSSWEVCRRQRVETMRGCGFFWSPSGDASPDIDVLAGGIGRNVRNLKVGGSSLSGAQVKRCGEMRFPSPGSTPCGACQVGFATPTRVYISLESPFDKQTAYPVQLGPLSYQVQVVQVPAHQTLVSQAMTLPRVGQQGVPLMIPTRD